MDKEEAINYLKSSGFSEEQIDTIVKALQSKVCNDAISKAAVIKLIDKHTNDDGTLDDDITCILEEFSPRWVWDEKVQVYRCSVCNHFPWRVDTGKNDEVFVDLKRLNAYRYCPYCGAKMEEE